MQKKSGRKPCTAHSKNRSRNKNTVGVAESCRQILAILSEYISRLMMTNQNRPIYIITKESRSLILTRKQQINVVSSDRVDSDPEEVDPAK